MTPGEPRHRQIAQNPKAGNISQFNHNNKILGTQFQKRIIQSDEYIIKHSHVLHYGDYRNVLGIKDKFLFSIVCFLILYNTDLKNDSH